MQENLGVSANVLSDRLDTLVGEGLLETRVYQERPERHEYHLTEKGLDLVPALLALMAWGDRWAWPGRRGPVRAVHEACGETVSVELRCEHCDTPVAPDELLVALTRPGGRMPAEGEPGRLAAELLAAAPGGIPVKG